jgi:hypothetical protein
MPGQGRCGRELGCSPFVVCGDLACSDCDANSNADIHRHIDQYAERHAHQYGDRNAD